MGKMPDNQEQFNAAFQDILAEIPDVSSPLHGLTLAQAEVCRHYQQAGFERAEALYMTAVMFTGTPGPPPPTMEN